MKTTLEVVEGLRFERGYLSPYFVTDPGDMEAVLENALVLLTDLRITAAQERARRARARGAGADGRCSWSPTTSKARRSRRSCVNRLRGTLSRVAVRAPESGDRRRELLEDLALLTGAPVMTRRARPHARAVRARRISDVRSACCVDRDTTTLIEGGGNAATIRRRLAQLERELAASESEHDRGSRCASGSGAAQRRRRGDPRRRADRARDVRARGRFEDALAATRAAVEEGLVTGGGVALLRAQARLDAIDNQRRRAVGLEIVRRALEEPARQIADERRGGGRRRDRAHPRRQGRIRLRRADG